MLGVTYPAGFLDNPKNHRYRASIVLLGPTGNLLVDCSPELRLQLTRENVTEVESVLITHTHADHVMGMDDLRSIVILSGKPMTVYARPEHQEDIRRIYPYAFREFPPGIEVPRFDLMDVPNTIHIGGMEVHTFTVPHGNVQVTGLRVDDFAYVTDVSDIPEDVEAKLQGLETLVLDAVRFRPHPNHLHFEKAMMWAERLGAKMTYFTHLSSDYDHDEFEKTLPENIRLAYDRLQISF